MPLTLSDLDLRVAGGDLFLGLLTEEELTAICGEDEAQLTQTGVLTALGEDARLAALRAATRSLASRGLLQRDNDRVVVSGDLAGMLQIRRHPTVLTTIDTTRSGITLRRWMFSTGRETVLEQQSSAGVHSFTLRSATSAASALTAVADRDGNADLVDGDVITVSERREHDGAASMPAVFEAPDTLTDLLSFRKRGSMLAVTRIRVASRFDGLWIETGWDEVPDRIRNVTLRSASRRALFDTFHRALSPNGEAANPTVRDDGTMKADE